MAMTQKEKSARYYQKHKEEILTKHRQWNKDNIERKNKHRMEYYEQNKLNILNKQKIRRRRLHDDAVRAYGGKCEICGESHMECLTIDHALNDGNVFRKEHPELFRGSGSFYVWLKNRDYPKDLGLRVLCWNCNCSRGLYGYSPYEVENGKSTRT